MRKPRTVGHGRYRTPSAPCPGYPTTIQSAEWTIAEPNWLTTVVVAMLDLPPMLQLLARVPRSGMGPGPTNLISHRWYNQGHFDSEYTSPEKKRRDATQPYTEKT